MSAAAAVLAAVRARGLTVSACGDDIEVEGYLDALTPDLQDALKEHKPEVLRLLSDTPASEDSTPGLPPFEGRPHTCDDCGMETVVLLVTDYGSRYCRRCIRPAPSRSDGRAA